MITDRMADALNTHLNAEIYSAYLYLSMSAAASHAGLPGTANWLNIQAREEMTHSEKFYNYIDSVGARVVLEAIEKPPTDFGSPENIYASVLEHEQKVTALVNALVDLAREEKDHATDIFLQWFVTEQVEEEENVGDILAQIKLAGAAGLFMIDRELGARVFTPPA